MTDQTEKRAHGMPLPSTGQSMSAAGGSKSRATVAFFDSIAEGYRELYDENTPGGYPFTIRRRRVLELFDAAGGDVLDVGCGSGVMVEALTGLGCRFWGIDPSVGMIEAAVKTFSSVPGVHFCVGSAQDLGFPEEAFDAVISMGVLERVPDDEAALGEMVRVLKPGGLLIVTLPNGACPTLWWRDYVFYPVVALLRPVHRWLTRAKKSPVIPGHKLYGPRSYAASLARHGCEVTDVVYCVYSIFLAPLDALFPRLTTAFMKKAEGLHRSPLRWLGTSFIVKARKRAPVDV